MSLGAPARLQLRRGGPGGERREVVLAPAGDPYVLAGAARWAWQHHVPPVRAERVAIIFRTIPSARRAGERGCAATPA